MIEPKRRRGRPKLHTEAVERSQVSLPVSVSAKLRALGGDSLSQGITAASYRVPDAPRPPKRRYVVVTDPDEIEAIKRAGLRDPIGGCLNGQWFAEAHSLAQYRKQPVEFEV
jgi:hypothetical protein